MNRKMIKSIIAALCMTFVTLTMISCGAKADEYGLYNNIDDAYSAAQKKNQEIIVVLTVAGDDYISSDFIANVLHTEEFKNDIAENYAVVHIDFGQETYEKTIVDETASKEEQKAAKEYAELMQDNSIFASRLNIKMTPAFVLFTKDEYFITDIEYTIINSVSEFKDLLEDCKPAILDMNEKVAATKTGTKIDKINAIDNLYNSTETEYRPFLYDLIEQVTVLDKKNESGLVGKYILAKADMEAVMAYQAGDIDSASKKYVSVCDNKYLNPEQKQQAYYMAAYLLSVGGSDEYQPIVQYLNKAIEASPDSPAVEHIQSVLSALEQIIANGMIE